MIWVIRIALVFGAVLVIRPAGAILSVLFVSDLSQPGFTAELAMVLVFCIGWIALAVSAFERLFSNAWLLALAALGLASVGATRLGASCADVNFELPSYESYLCSSSFMAVGLIGICITFVLIVALRRTGLLPNPEPLG